MKQKVPETAQKRNMEIPELFWTEFVNLLQQQFPLVFVPRKQCEMYVCCCNTCNVFQFDLIGTELHVLLFVDCLQTLWIDVNLDMHGHVLMLLKQSFPIPMTCLLTYQSSCSSIQLFAVIKPPCISCLCTSFNWGDCLWSADL